MVGSVLMDRMQAEGDFASSSRCSSAPAPRRQGARVAKNETTLQGRVRHRGAQALRHRHHRPGRRLHDRGLPKLRAAGWTGHWIDAASTLRMKDDAVIVLDPVNLPVIQEALRKGGRNWIGGNCTVSCMLMGVGALYKAGLVEWMSTQTYPGRIGRRRAAHARAADAVRHAERGSARAARRSEERHPRDRSQDRRQAARAGRCRDDEFRRAAGRQPDPWIDKDLGNGVSREEWKGGAETNKILGQGEGFGTPAVPVDGFCVRVGTMRCHSQALTFKLKKDVPLATSRR
jgi:aspartate-semialdehyde dehydrogenase